MSRRISATAKRSYPWSGLDSDSRNSVLLIGGIAVIILAALALIGYGYYNDRIKPNHATVIRVGNKTFDYTFVERRARAEMIKGRLDTTDLGNSLYSLLETIQKEEVMRQTAARENVTASEEEIEQRYFVKLSLPTNSSREQLAGRLRSELRLTGLTLSDYRDIAKAEVLERKVRAQFDGEAPAQAEQVDLQLMQLATQADALKARDRLAGGDSFGVIAVDSSTYKGAKDNAGDLSWTPKEALPPEVGDVTFSLDVGKTSEIIEAKQGFFIVRVNAKEAREVNDEIKNRIVQESLDELVAETKDEVGAAITMTTNQIQKLALAVNTLGAGV